jgi:hypothetical protein
MLAGRPPCGQAFCMTTCRGLPWHTWQVARGMQDFEMTTTKSRPAARHALLVRGLQHASGSHLGQPWLACGLEQHQPAGVGEGVSCDWVHKLVGAPIRHPAGQHPPRGVEEKRAEGGELRGGELRGGELRGSELRRRELDNGLGGGEGRDSGTQGGAPLGFGLAQRRAPTRWYSAGRASMVGYACAKGAGVQGSNCALRLFKNITRGLLVGSPPQ